MLRLFLAFLFQAINISVSSFKLEESKSTCFTIAMENKPALGAEAGHSSGIVLSAAPVGYCRKTKPKND